MGGVNIDKQAQLGAARDIGFQGQNIDAGFGNVTFSPGGGATLTGGGPNQGIAQMLAAQGGAGMRAAAGGIPGVANLGQAQVSQSQQMMNEVQGFNPLDAAETRFNRLQGILDRGRNRTRDSAESRLLAQGRLGGEGGARQLEGMEAQFDNQDALMLDRMFGEAEAARRGGISDALQVGSSGAGIRSGLAQEGLAGSQSAADINNAQSQNLLQLINAGAGLGSAETQAELARAGSVADYNNTLIAKGGSGGGLSSALTGLATGFGTAFGGPAGGAAAGGIASLF